MTSIFQAGQPFNLVRTSNATYQASDKDLVISSGDEVALPSPDQGATVLVRPAPSIDSVNITTSNGTIGNTGETFGIYGATEPIYLVGDGTNWYARSGGGEISAIPDSAVAHWPHDSGSGDIVDNIGNVNATLGSNATWQSGVGRGGFYVEYDTTATGSGLGGAGNTLISDNWVANNTGAFGCWINPQANDFMKLFGTESTDEGTDTGCLLRPQNKIQWSLTVNNSRTDIRPSAYRTNDWQAVVFTCDGSNMFIYHSDSNDTVSQIISATAPGTDSNGLLDTDPTIGDGDKFATLEQDDAWFTDQHVTVSEAQAWVDATASDH